MNNICLFCYKPIKNDKKIDYHPKCCGKFFGSSEPSELDFPMHKITQLAKRIVEKHVTVTGVQPKISLNLSKESGSKQKFTILGLLGAYIIKLQTPDYCQLPENEDLTMHLADSFSIPVVPHSLIKTKSQELAYITKRIDRIKNNQKIHMEDMCQLSERLTEDKYKGSFESIGKIIKKYSANTGYDLQIFFEIILFSFLVGNSDMHLKNFSLCINSSENIALAPAYDLLNTKIVLCEDKEETALTLNGKKSKISKKDFDIFAGYLGIKDKVLANIYNKFAKKITGASLFIESSFLTKKMQKDYLKIFTYRCSRIFI